MSYILRLLVLAALAPALTACGQLCPAGSGFSYDRETLSCTPKSETAVRLARITETSRMVAMPMIAEPGTGGFIPPDFESGLIRGEIDPASDGGIYPQITETVDIQFHLDTAKKRECFELAERAQNLGRGLLIEGESERLYESWGPAVPLEPVEPAAPLAEAHCVLIDPSPGEPLRPLAGVSCVRPDPDPPFPTPLPGTLIRFHSISKCELL